LLVYSRIPLVLAQDGLLPAALARTDTRGTPANAVLVSAVVYSLFSLLPFGGLLAGDVLLYTAALGLEFAALIRLRRAEPGLRGAFRVPLGVPWLVALASLPLVVLALGVALEVRSRSEERRVGKECRFRGGAARQKKKSDRRRDVVD